MHIVFLLGWALMIAAFTAAASEPFVMVSGGGRGVTNSILTSAYDLWYTLAPGHLVLTKISIERILPILWDPILMSLLYLPAWLLLGGPGLVMAWTCRPNKVLPPEMQEEYDRHQESLFIIDALNQEARQDDSYHPDEDDRLPVHELFDLDKSADEEIRNSVLENDIPAGFPSLEDMEEATGEPNLPDIDALYAEIARHEAEDRENTDPSGGAAANNEDSVVPDPQGGKES